MASQNLQTTNPQQLNDRVSAIQVALELDEVNNLLRNLYTSAGAIATSGLVLLKTGAASAMTLALPLAGDQLAGGQDFAKLTIVALDAHAYTVTTPANGIAPSHDTLTCAAQVGYAITLIAYNGLWYPEIHTTGTPAWAATEV